MSNELWNKWSDVHNSPDQQKRIASAKKSACTPVSLDQSACTGTFKGSSGTHTTSLNHCSFPYLLYFCSICEHDSTLNRLCQYFLFDIRTFS